MKKSWQVNKKKSFVGHNLEKSTLRKEKIKNIILKRSHFIIKIKFEKYEKDFIEILQMNTSKPYYKITINKFIRVIKEIFNKLHFSIHQYTSPIEVLDQKRADSLVHDSFCLNRLFYFMYENRENYNNLIKHLKSIKDNVDEKVIDKEKLEEHLTLKEHQNNNDQTNQQVQIEKGTDISYVSKFTTFPNSIPYLFFESIPYILTDFLSKNNNIYAIDTQNDSKNKVKSSLI